jgi:hypothetical protein
VGFRELQTMSGRVNSICRIAAAACALLVVAAAPSRAFELEPGTWKELETGTENGKWVPPGTNTICLTPEQAAEPAKGLSPERNLERMRGQCKTLDVKQSASSLAMRVQCGDPAKVLMSFDLDYVFNNARSYSGTVKSAVTISGKAATAAKKVEGRWMSSICKRKPAAPGE